MSLHFINVVEQILSGAEPCLLVTDLDELTTDGQITFREMIRTTFLNKGVEIEYSGKGINERGVVIDIDEEALARSGYAADVLRFGQTVVRVKG